MWFKLKAKIIIVMIATAIIVPGSLSSHALTAHAANCWSPVEDLQMWATPASNVSWTGDVTFQVGFASYDCSANPTDFHIISQWEQMTFTNDYVTSQHGWTQAGWCPESGNFWCSSGGGYDPSVNTYCTGSPSTGNTCTITQTEYWDAYTAYNVSVATTSHWYNACSPGNDLCSLDILFQFWAGSVYMG